MYNVEFPEMDDSSVKVGLSGAAKLGIFPVCVLDISNTHGTTELLLCYNEFGIFVDETGRRTRAVEPTWSHFPFTFGRYLQLYINYVILTPCGRSALIIDIL